MDRDTAIGFRLRSAAEANASSPVWRVLTRAIGWFAQARRVRRDLHTLAALDERQLAEIGLRRADVERTLPRDVLGVTRKSW